MEYDSSSINLLRPAIVFVPNRGQAAGSARFTARTSGQNLYFHEDGLTAVLFSLEKSTLDQQATRMGSVIKITFLGASHSVLQALHPAAGQFHYFTGNDPSNWRTHIPSYEQLQYANLWDGVNLTLAGEKEGLKFLWSLSHPSRVSSIRVRYEGAEEIRIAQDGSLVIRHTLGELIDPAPIAWQEIGGRKKPVDCAYVLNGDTVSFAISGAYAATAPLFIDPILPYSTYLGGGSYDFASAIAADTKGCAYVGGMTASDNFPTTPGAFETTYGGIDMAFLTKFAADGKTLVYSTYLGGSTNATYCRGLAVDQTGIAYMTGETYASDFPTTPGAFQPARNDGFDAFVTKVSADGASLVYSTYLGGNSDDYANGIAVDDAGFAYVTGETYSSDFPTTPGAFQTVHRGRANAFLSKFTQDGSALVYSTYFGGNAGTRAAAIAVDKQGHAYITGITGDDDLPVTPGAFQTALKGSSDAFITQFSASGASLVYSTYLGGSDTEYAYGIALDSSDCAVAAGITTSTNFPVTPGAFQTASAGGFYEAFITKVSPDGGSLIASTYLGGSELDQANAVALDAQDNVYVTGYTNSPNFPITPQVLPSIFQSFNVFVSILSPRLNHLLVSYYQGSSDVIDTSGIAVGADGALYVTGYAYSNDFPTTPGAFQHALAGQDDAFVTKEGFVLLKQASISMKGMP